MLKIRHNCRECGREVTRFKTSRDGLAVCYWCTKRKKCFYTSSKYRYDHGTIGKVQYSALRKFLLLSTPPLATCIHVGYTARIPLTVTKNKMFTSGVKKRVMKVLGEAIEKAQREHDDYCERLEAKLDDDKATHLEATVNGFVGKFVK